jgi:hypothetical protein
MKTYIIYDGRARSDIYSASCLDTADTLKEARAAAKSQGSGCVIVEYDRANDPKSGTDVLSNPRIVK